jgi:hypothetical protein
MHAHLSFSGDPNNIADDPPPSGIKSVDVMSNSFASFLVYAASSVGLRFRGLPFAAIDGDIGESDFDCFPGETKAQNLIAIGGRML